MKHGLILWVFEWEAIDSARQDSESPSSLSRCDCSLASAALIGLEAWI